MKTRLPVIVASILGAGAIHFTLAACSGSNAAGGGAGGDSTQDARAQSAPEATSCTTWQMATFYQPAMFSETNYTPPTGLSNPITLPDGWEPLEASPFTNSGSTTGNSSFGVLAVVRHCVK